jgi:hypothetical protein
MSQFAKLKGLNAKGISELREGLHHMLHRAESVKGSEFADDMPEEFKVGILDQAQRDEDLANDMLVMLDISHSMIGMVELAAHGHVSFRMDGDTPFAAVICNDVFSPGADAHVLSPFDGIVFSSMFALYGVSGLYALIAFKRSQEPVEAFRTPEYIKGRDYIVSIEQLGKETH